MISSVLQYIKKSTLNKYIIYEKTINSSAGSFVSIDILNDSIASELLKSNNISHLYSHQFEAYKLVNDEHNILLTTPTASGKTICYNLPILTETIKNRNTKALYLFPMKALGHDQKRQLDEFINNTKYGKIITSSVIDGDTTKTERRKILKDPPNIIISNIDILHYTIMSHLSEWREFLNDVKFIVMDEIHAYKGIFGSHVYNIYKRFFRLFKNIQFIVSSATIGNPLGFTEKLIGKKFTLINKNGAPSGKKQFLLLNPDIPLSSIATYLIRINLNSNIKTICFTKSRRETEQIYINLINSDPTLKNIVSSYRAGFLAEERREIERKLQNDILKAVISTSAFELGIDIGGIDSTILVGYPGSLINLWQRAGRSGRNTKDSLIILIAGRDALDQYYTKTPEKLLNGKFEEMTVDSENSEINKKHIHCAAYEKPINIDEEYYKFFKDDINALIDKNELFLNADNTQIFTLNRYPYKHVDLRQIGDSYNIICNNLVLGMNSARRVYTEMYKGAVYLHRGSTFIVQKIDKSRREIYVKPENINYYTLPLVEKETIIIKVFKEKVIKNLKAIYCELKVTETLKGYTKISTKTGEKLQEIELSCEPISFNTKGISLVLDEHIYETLKEKHFNQMGSIHAAEHSLIALIPTFILCDRSDVGGISYPYHPQLEKPAIFLYDGYPGGIGINKRIYDVVENLITQTYYHVKECECLEGCPACIYSPKCGSGNYPLDKKGCLYLIDALLNKKVEHNKKYTVNNRRENNSGIIVFDLETKYSAASVGGFKNAHLMGISVAVAYNLITKKYLYFKENEIDKLIDTLENAKLIIGFNIINFDFKVITGYRSLNIKNIPKLDIFLDIKNITGRRFSLEKIATSTINAKKSGNGLLALKWYEEGLIDKILKYCKKDVEITTDILLYGITNGCVFVPVQNTSIRVPVNWNYVHELINLKNVTKY
ncbi:MAG: DEAD/DEAH box helicase [Deferribacterota bacterium]|nr:DEAD/DEAH box helicase [Deferribacterota bacterium]